MPMKIRVLTHSSIRIESEEGIFCLDPFQTAAESHDADMILITHDHHDHFSPEDIRKAAKPETVLIVPEAMEEKAKLLSGTVKSIETVVPGERYCINGLTLETVPAYNNLKPFHPKKAGWVGYILTLNGKRIYIAGDTDLTKENKEISCDIALVPVGGTYTMDAKKAAELVNAIAPETAIPTHYGSVVGKAADAKTFASLVKPPTKIEICMEQLK